jgi:hypothetical protein
VGAFLKKKYNAFYAFKTFKNVVEKEIGRVVKVLKSNNGEKIINCDFTRYCENNGIKKQFS